MKKKIMWAMTIVSLLAMTIIAVLFGLVGYYKPPSDAKAYFVIVFISGFCGGIVYLWLFSIGEQIVKNIRHRKVLAKQSR